uniref:ribonuclease H n=1 Tax=Oryzias melastigma TaxID=30732 RepID=A0A3B3DLR5_ORYME
MNTKEEWRKLLKCTVVEFLCDTGADKTVIRKPLPGIPHSSEMIYVKSANGIISSCPVTGPITVVDPHSGLKHTQSVILCPSCPVNLLGRDLMLKLHISVVSTDSGMMAIGQGEEVPTYISSGQEPHYYWTLDFPQPDPTNTMTRLLQLADESLRHMADTDVGLLTTATPVVITPKTEYRPRIRQYPLKPDATQGIMPVIQDMLKSGVIIEAPWAQCNTPIFPVKKAETGQWRLVQDLRAVNQAIESRAPCVPDPHTLLNQLQSDKAWFTVVDLSNAFFSIPLHPNSQGWFGFTIGGKKYTYTRLPQGFCDSPTIFTAEINNCLSDFPIPAHSQVLVYVDDILIASDTKEHNLETSISLFKHLCSKGSKASPSKLQLTLQSVIFLGHQLTPQGKSITNSRKKACGHLYPQQEGMLERMFGGAVGLSLFSCVFTQPPFTCCSPSPIVSPFLDALPNMVLFLSLFLKIIKV